MRASIHPQALIEYREAVIYYGEQASRLGEEFSDEVKAAVAALRASPRTRAADFRGMRRYLLQRFPYVVRYRINRVSAGDDAEIVMVYAIQHVRRDQSNWLYRLAELPETR